MEPSNKKKWDVLERTHTSHVVEKDRMIYWQEALADEFYYLKSGKVKIFLSSEDGAEKTLTVLEPGNIFGEAAFFDGMPRVSSAKALVKSEIITVTRKSLMECIRREPQLAMNLLTYLSQTIRMLSAQVNSMTFLQADQRLARLLLSLARNGTVRATQDDLAGLAGISRVTVNRTLAGFSKRGWIRARYGAVEIRDEVGLLAFIGG
ncbi:Crp/Fnr family transcriptional regulator [Caproiciproducens galactitolivorans]|uniref:cAMP receptor protein n=1 Tax=Caproiciproducens galactitolivorans TaxID=642589 RepID=A0A4Z0Y0A0_9FIRM|nr:Crp/Fnr family transcriptional regulator [Caproiciproducens galactitolivorans]QEY35460.1 Crp/Fnr family transcriptional regulator [Caproiciproducens galactitolivorans]TGJ77174.1 cAMP receptor protein [Caproiciproducens galactitolivorans]